ncbi:MAG: YwqG family protein [Planctomycetota bacterium]|nr:YwqG family protein [Planctomycetota bacterium]
MSRVRSARQESIVTPVDASVETRVDTIEALRTLLAQRGFDSEASTRVLAAAHVCLGFRLIRETDDAKIPIGATKVAGAADLPSGTAWPAARGVHFRFIAQFDLSAVSRLLPQSPLPERGLLSFFWCQEHEIGTTSEGVRVIHTPDTSSLVRMKDPWSRPPKPVGLLGRMMGKRPAPQEDAFCPCRVELALKVTIPIPDGPRGIVTGLVSTDEFRVIHRGIQEKDPATVELLDVGHRLLGEPLPIQEFVELDAEWDPNVPAWEDWDARVKAAATWRLLLQVDADDAPEFRFGDLGSIYFMIRETDLSARRWDNVCVVMQSH